MSTETLDTPQAPEAQDYDLSSATDAISSLFSGGEDPKKRQDDEPQQQEDEPSDDDPNAHPDGDDNPPVDAPEDDDDVTIEVKIDGKPVKMTKAEIIEAHKNGLRQSDYTKKTMELAEQRKQVEAQAQAVPQLRQQFVQQLQGMQQSLQAAVQSGQLLPPDPGLIESNPQEYLRQQTRWQNANQVAAQIQQNLAAAHMQEQQENQQRFAQHLRAEQEQLLAKLPEWRDDGKRAEEAKVIVSYLQAQGYSPEEMDRIFHSSARNILTVRDAAFQARSLEAQKAAKEKLAKAPQKPAVKPGAAAEATASMTNQSAKQRLRKSGSIDDATAVLASMFKVQK